MLSPQSIAIVGASSDPVRIGGRSLARLISEGFPGPIYPVNPARDSVQGIPAVKSVLDLPEGVDCAIVVIPAEQAVAAICDCATRKVGSVVLMSAGFAEAGGRGVELQDELTAIACASGMRIVGPNCMGLFNVADKTHLSFSSWVPDAVSPTFNLAVVSQSGGYGTHVLRLCQRRDIVVSHWLTTGNECDVNAGELLDVVSGLPQVNAVFLYLEGLRSTKALIAGLEKAHARRLPVVVIKAGCSEVGAAAAASHTASLAGSDKVYDAVFRTYGAFRANSTEEAIDIIYALSRGVLPADMRTCAFTLSGGMGVQIADYMAEYGVLLDELSASAQATIKALVPQAGTRNPVDITAQFLNDMSLVEASLDLVLGRENFSVVLSFLSTVGLVPHLAAPIAKIYSEMNRRYPGRLNVIAMIGTPEVVQLMEDAGCLVFEEARRAARALGALRFFAQAFSRPLSRRGQGSGKQLPRIERGQRFNEIQAKEIAQTIGIPVPKEVVATGPAEAARLAQLAGFPVAIKVVSVDILHKTEVGGVRLGLADAQAVHRAVEAMADSVRQKSPGASIEGYMVSPMIADGVECVVGVMRDPAFGPVVMFGLGGVLIELMKDVAFRLAPVDERQALEMIRETRGAHLLEGYRDAPPSDVPALARAIAAVSELAAANADSLLTLELNPLRVRAAGQGVIALDAVIETQLG